MELYSRTQICPQGHPRQFSPPQGEQTHCRLPLDFRPWPQGLTVSTNHLTNRALGTAGPINLQGVWVPQHSLGAGVLLSDPGRRPPGNVRGALGDELVQVMLNHLLPLEDRESQDISVPGAKPRGVTTPTWKSTNLAPVPALMCGY